MARLLFISALALSSLAICTARASLFSTGFQSSDSSSQHDTHQNQNQNQQYTAPRNINFPPQFYVTTGTTIPLIEADPIAQSGAIYYDEINQRVRVDNFWLGTQRSFIADLGQQRGYVLNNDQCTVLKLTGDLKRYGVPDGAVRSVDPVAVRAVPVLQYSAVEREETVQQIDFFIRPMNLSYVFDGGFFGSSESVDTDDDDLFYSSEEGPEEEATAGAVGKYSGGGASDTNSNTNKRASTHHQSEAAAKENRDNIRKQRRAAERESTMKSDEGAFFIPWQIRSKRLRQRVLAAGPANGGGGDGSSSSSSVPNWRFFGETMDEIVTAEEAAEEFGVPNVGPDGKPLPRAGVLERLVDDVTITVDFFNFVPSQPSASVFEMPDACRGSSAANSNRGGGGGANADYDKEYSYTINVHQTQRLLIDMTFNSAHGRRVMGDLWRSSANRVAAAASSHNGARAVARSLSSCTAAGAGGGKKVGGATDPKNTVKTENVAGGAETAASADKKSTNNAGAGDL